MAVVVAAKLLTTPEAAAPPIPIAKPSTLLAADCEALAAMSSAVTPAPAKPGVVVPSVEFVSPAWVVRPMIVLASAPAAAAPPAEPTVMKVAA